MKRFTLSLAPLFLSAAALVAADMRIPQGYRVETIDIPKNITLGVGGLAFNRAGELMISTREGEVWRYDTVKKTWNLFAEGLHEALGIYVDRKTDETWVMQRPEMTKLIDTDGDGKADIYKTVAAAWGLTDNYHEYAFGLVRDDAGNFYGTLNTTLSWVGWAGSDRWDIGRVHDSKMGRAAKYRGWSFMVTPQGEFIPFSNGMRSPCGLGRNKAGEIFYTDNQGDWNASSTLHHVVKGRFHGHPSSLMDDPKFAGKDLNLISVDEYDKMRTRPAIWFPHGELASSPGQPEFDETGGKFGPFEGQVIIGDQTRSNLMRAALEKVDGEYQGVVFDFIDPLQCGVVRNIFGPDGSLWAGQTGRGWRSVGEVLFGLQRIVWDGQTVPTEMHHVNLTPDGFEITFTQPMKREQLVDAASYAVKSWGFLYQGEYGSPKLDETSFPVTNIKASADNTKVSFTVPLKASKVYQITLRNLKSSADQPVTNPTGYYTLNHLRK